MPCLLTLALVVRLLFVASAGWGAPDAIGVLVCLRTPHCELRFVSTCCLGRVLLARVTRKVLGGERDLSCTGSPRAPGYKRYGPQWETIRRTCGLTGRTSWRNNKPRRCPRRNTFWTGAFALQSSRQKPLSGPWFGALQAYLPTCLLLRRSVLADTSIML